MVSVGDIASRLSVTLTLCLPSSRAKAAGSRQALSERGAGMKTILEVITYLLYGPRELDLKLAKQAPKTPESRDAPGAVVVAPGNHI